MSNKVVINIIVQVSHGGIFLRVQVGSRPDQNPEARQVRVEVPTMLNPGSQVYVAVEPKVVVDSWTCPLGISDKPPQLTTAESSVKRSF